MNFAIKKIDYIYPFVNDLVDILYNTDLNNLIHDSCKTVDDKRSFFMFIIMYFYTFLSCSNDCDKDNLKLFLSDLLKNTDKRKKIIEMYLNMEQNVKYLLN